MKNRFRLITKKSAGVDFSVLAVYDVEDDKSYIWNDVDDVKELFKKINNLAESSSEVFADFLKNPEVFKYTDNKGLVEKKRVEINEKDKSVTFTIPEEVIKSIRYKDPLKPPYEIT